jgi:tetratricopeptide (TPR) repeat protein
MRNMQRLIVALVIVVSGCGLAKSDNNAAHIDSLYAKALSADSAKDMRACIRYSTAILHDDSAQYLALTLRGMALVRTSKHASGLADLTKAVGLHPCDFTFTHRGEAYNITGQYEKAREDFLAAISLNPGYERAYYGMAISMAYVGSRKQALAICEKADSIKYKALNSHHTRLNIYHCYDEKDLELVELSACIDLDSTYDMYFNNRGYIYLLKEHYVLALPDLEKAIRLDSTKAYPHNNKGYVLYKLGHPQPGLDEITHSLAIDNSNAYAYRNRAEIFLSMKQFKRASEDLLLAQHYNHDSTLAKEILALWRRLGKKK